MKPFKNKKIYNGYSTYSHCTFTSFPPPDLCKNGPANCLPVWHSKLQNNHTNDSNVGPSRLPKCSLKSIKMDIRAKVSIGCPCGPLDPQNGHSGYPKYKFCIQTMTHFSRPPASSCLLIEGWRQGRRVQGMIK